VQGLSVPNRQRTEALKNAGQYDDDLFTLEYANTYTALQTSFWNAIAIFQFNKGL